MSRGFAFSHVLLCKIFNVHCGSTSEIFSVARKGRKQVSTCGHKFSMLEKLLSTQSSLLGQALVGAKPLHLACARPRCHLKAPLGLSLLRNRGPSPNPAPALRWFQRKSGVSHYIALSIPERAFIIFTGGRI